MRHVVSPRECIGAACVLGLLAHNLATGDWADVLMLLPSAPWLIGLTIDGMRLHAARLAPRLERLRRAIAPFRERAHD